MTFWKVIKILKYNQLRHLFWLSIKHPLFIYPTLKATANSYTIAKQEYPKTHHLNGKGNAFRHALWNMLICSRCLKWNKNQTKVLAWVKRITDKHEDLSLNKPLNRAMDLHNNEVGRELFLELHNNQAGLHINMLIDSLKEKLKSSVKVETIVEMDAHKEALVYITEFN